MLMYESSTGRLISLGLGNEIGQLKSKVNKIWKRPHATVHHTYSKNPAADGSSM